MLARTYLVVLLFIMIALSTLPLHVCGIYEGYKRGLNLATLAVGGNYGVVIPVYIEVSYPGNGEITIQSMGYGVSPDVRSSIEYAIRLASRFSGTHFNDYDYKVVIKSEYNVSGLSATLAFTLGFITLLRNDPWDGNATATGLLAPNGVVGNISGILLKYKAARENGYIRVIGPYTPALLQSEHYYPASTFIDSYEYFIGKKLYPQYVKVFEEILFNNSKDIIYGFYKAWNELYNYSREIIDYVDENMDLLPSNLRKYVENYLTIGLKSVNESIVQINESNYYTGASRAFYGFWNILTAYNIIRYYMDREGFLDTIRDQYNKNYSVIRDHIVRKYIGKGELSIEEIDIIVNAYERLFESKYLFNESLPILLNESSSIEEQVYALQSISVAIARLYTARQWSNLIDYVSSYENKLFTYDVIKEVLREEMDLAETMYNYILYLFKGKGKDFLEKTIKEPLDDAKKFIDVDPLYAFSEIMKVERDLGNTLLSIPTYTIVNRFVLEDIRRTVVRIMTWYLLYENITLPSGFTAMEFLETSGNLSLSALSTALLHALVYKRLYSFIEKVEESTSETYSMQFLFPHDYLRAIAIAGAVAVIIISSIIFSMYSISRKHLSKSIQRESFVLPPPVFYEEHREET